MQRGFVSEPTAPLTNKSRQSGVEPALRLRSGQAALQENAQAEACATENSQPQKASVGH